MLFARFIIPSEWPETNSKTERVGEPSGVIKPRGNEGGKGEKGAGDPREIQSSLRMLQHIK